MKNIHVLPTDKPSRLSIIDSQLIYSKEYFINAQNIYITSDEEIKDGDWVLEISTNAFWQIQIQDKTDLSKYKKIILTTDQDLIKDAVQSIDDEFLEWFVKNPSCEYIIFERLEDGKYVDYLSDGSTFEGIYENYKIIIPQEEVLLQSSIDGEPILGEEPKQETLEEAAEKYNSQFIGQNEFAIEDFKNGAKWQQEQDKKMYSGEDMPTNLEPVLAKITHQNDLGLSQWYEVVLIGSNGKWCCYSGSKTFRDGERVIAWKYCKDLI